MRKSSNLPSKKRVRTIACCKKNELRVQTRQDQVETGKKVFSGGQRRKHKRMRGSNVSLRGCRKSRSYFVSGYS